MSEAPEGGHRPKEEPDLPPPRAETSPTRDGPSTTDGRGPTKQGNELHGMMLEDAADPIPLKPSRARRRHESTFTADSRPIPHHDWDGTVQPSTDEESAQAAAHADPVVAPDSEDEDWLAKEKAAVKLMLAASAMQGQGAASSPSGASKPAGASVDDHDRLHPSAHKSRTHHGWRKYSGDGISSMSSETAFSEPKNREKGVPTEAKTAAEGNVATNPGLNSGAAVVAAAADHPHGDIDSSLEQAANDGPAAAAALAAPSAGGGAVSPPFKEHNNHARADDAPADWSCSTSPNTFSVSPGETDGVNQSTSKAPNRGHTQARRLSHNVIVSTAPERAPSPASTDDDDATQSKRTTAAPHTASNPAAFSPPQPAATSNSAPRSQQPLSPTVRGAVTTPRRRRESGSNRQDEPSTPSVMVAPIARRGVASPSSGATSRASALSTPYVADGTTPTTSELWGAEGPRYSQLQTVFFGGRVVIGPQYWRLCASFSATILAYLLLMGSMATIAAPGWSLALSAWFIGTVVTMLAAAFTDPGAVSRRQNGSNPVNIPLYLTVAVERVPRGPTKDQSETEDRPAPGRLPSTNRAVDAVPHPSRDAGADPSASLLDRVFARKFLLRKSARRLSAEVAPSDCVSKSAVAATKYNLRYCYTCQRYRGPRGFHCVECGCCVDVFDHHCPWLGTCIGAKNYPFFVAYLHFMNAFAFTGLLMIVIVPASCSAQNGSAVLDCLRPMGYLPIILIVPGLAVAMGVLCLLMYHWYLAWYGLTTLEHLRIMYDADCPNLFDEGELLSNCGRWCGVVDEVALADSYRDDHVEVLRRLEPNPSRRVFEERAPL